MVTGVLYAPVLQPMCCDGVCVQGLHSTGHLQYPIHALAIRVTTLTLP